MTQRDEGHDFRDTKNKAQAYERRQKYEAIINMVIRWLNSNIDEPPPEGVQEDSANLKEKIELEETKLKLLIFCGDNDTYRVATMASCFLVRANTQKVAIFCEKGNHFDSLVRTILGNPFTQVTNIQPALIVDRNVEMPILLQSLSDGQNLGTSLPIWVAIVPVDSSSNAWFDNLETSMITLVDESILDPGAHLPVLSGIQAYWNLAGTDIEIIWDISNNEKVMSYSAYYSLDPFSDTRNASLLENNVTSNKISFNTFNGFDIDQSATYWIAIVASDGEVERLGVNPLEVKPWTDYTPGGGGLLDDGSGISWMEQLLEGNMNFIIIIQI